MYSVLRWRLPLLVQRNGLLVLGMRIQLVWIVYSMCTDVSTRVGSETGKRYPVREDEVG